MLDDQWNGFPRFSLKEFGDFFKAQWLQGKDSTYYNKLWSKSLANSIFSLLLQVVCHSHKHILKPEPCSRHGKATTCHTHPWCFQETLLYQQQYAKGQAFSVHRDSPSSIGVSSFEIIPDTEVHILTKLFYSFPPPWRCHSIPCEVMWKHLLLSSFNL